MTTNNIYLDATKEKIIQFLKPSLLPNNDKKNVILQPDTIIYRTENTSDLLKKKSSNRIFQIDKSPFFFSSLNGAKCYLTANYSIQENKQNSVIHPLTNILDFNSDTTEDIKYEFENFIIPYKLNRYLPILNLTNYETISKDLSRMTMILYLTNHFKLDIDKHYRNISNFACIFGINYLEYPHNQIMWNHENVRNHINTYLSDYFYGVIDINNYEISNNFKRISETKMDLYVLSNFVKTYNTIFNSNIEGIYIPTCDSGFYNFNNCITFTNKFPEELFIYLPSMEVLPIQKNKMKKKIHDSSYADNLERELFSILTRQSDKIIIPHLKLLYNTNFSSNEISPFFNESNFNTNSEKDIIFLENLFALYSTISSKIVLNKIIENLKIRYRKSIKDDLEYNYFTKEILKTYSPKLYDKLLREDFKSKFYETIINRIDTNINTIEFKKSLYNSVFLLCIKYFIYLDASVIIQNTDRFTNLVVNTFIQEGLPTKHDIFYFTALSNLLRNCVNFSSDIIKLFCGDKFKCVASGGILSDFYCIKDYSIMTKDIDVKIVFNNKDNIYKLDLSKTNNDDYLVEYFYYMEDLYVNQLIGLFISTDVIENLLDKFSSSVLQEYCRIIYQFNNSSDDITKYYKKIVEYFNYYKITSKIGFNQASKYPNHLKIEKLYKILNELSKHQELDFNDYRFFETLSSIDPEFLNRLKKTLELLNTKKTYKSQYLADVNNAKLTSQRHLERTLSSLTDMYNNRKSYINKLLNNMQLENERATLNILTLPNEISDILLPNINFICWKLWCDVSRPIPNIEYEIKNILNENELIIREIQLGDLVSIELIFNGIHDTQVFGFIDYTDNDFYSTLTNFIPHAHINTNSLVDKYNLTYGSFKYYLGETIKLYNICKIEYFNDRLIDGSLANINVFNKCSPQLENRNKKRTKYTNRFIQVNNYIERFLLNNLETIFLKFITYIKSHDDNSFKHYVSMGSITTLNELNGLLKLLLFSQRNNPIVREMGLLNNIENIDSKLYEFIYTTNFDTDLSRMILEIYNISYKNNESKYINKLECFYDTLNNIIDFGNIYKMDINSILVSDSDVNIYEGVGLLFKYLSIAINDYIEEYNKSTGQLFLLGAGNNFTK